MIVKFIGARDGAKKSCSVCGGKRIASGKFVTQKRCFLPSGGMKTFHYNQTYKVNEIDGQHLLSLTYHDRGLEKHMFEVVQ